MIWLSDQLISLYKVENKKEKIEDFKTAISSTVRSLSNSEKIEVYFGNQSPKSDKNSIASLFVSIESVEIKTNGKSGFNSSKLPIMFSSTKQGGQSTDHRPNKNSWP